MGQDIPRKRGPALTKSDILVINKTDLAPYVGVDLDLTVEDTSRMRQNRPFFLAQARNSRNIDQICDAIISIAGLSIEMARSGV
jgi:urease accessory protein